MLRSATHRLRGGRTLNLDNPKLCDFERELDDNSDPSPKMLEEYKDPIGTMVRRILKQFVSDEGALLSLAHDHAADLVRIEEFVQVPGNWRPRCEIGLKKNENGDYELTWSPINKNELPIEEPNSPVIPKALPLPPDFPNKKWAWVELMPLPPFMFVPFWERLVWHMRKVAAALDEGILLVRNEHREVNLRVARHAETLIVIQRSCC